jgi:hypothetical protein
MGQKYKSWYMLVVFGAFMLSLMVSVISAYHSQFTEGNNRDYQLETTATESYLTAQSQVLNTVDVGIYPLNIYDIDFQRNTFKMSAYVWMVWDADANVNGKPVKPMETFEITNIVDLGSFSRQDLTLEEMTNGQMYYLMKIDGIFFQPFDVSRYPLDTQQLNIVFEDTLWLDYQLLYRPNTDDTKLSNDVVIPGWDITKIGFLADTNQYDTQFGLINENQNHSYSQLVFSVFIERPVQFFAFKFVFPLSIILLFSLVSFWMPVDKFDVRIALSGSALLNLIFLQQLHGNEIVSSQQMVLIDLLYIYAYVSVITTLIDMIYSNYRFLQQQDEQYIVSRNRWVSIGHMAGFAILIAYIMVVY